MNEWTSIRQYCKDSLISMSYKEVEYTKTNRSSLFLLCRDTLSERYKNEGVCGSTLNSIVYGSHACVCVCVANFRCFLVISTLVMVHLRHACNVNICQTWSSHRWPHATMRQRTTPTSLCWIWISKWTYPSWRQWETMMTNFQSILTRNSFTSE